MDSTRLSIVADVSASGQSSVAARAPRVFSVFAVYLLISFVLLRTEISGDRSFFACCDASIQSYAWMGKVAAAARNFVIPLWDFSTLAGVSFAGELQPGPFYPLTWALGLLGFRGMPLVDTFMVLHFALAASFMHLLLRDIGLARAASIAGALIFTFTGYVPLQAAAQPNIYAGLIWIPLIFLFYRRAIIASRGREALTYATLAAVAGTMQIIAGHLQPFIYTSYAIGIYALVEATGGFVYRQREPHWWGRPIILFVIGQAMAVGLAAVPLALSIEYLRLVFRWYGDAENGGISTFPHIVSFSSWADGMVVVWKDFASLLNPALRMQKYGATMFFTLAGLFAAVLSIIKPNRLVVALWLVVAASIVIALGGSLGWVTQITYHLPLLAQTRTPVRAMYLFSFAAAVLAAIGIERAGRIAGGVRRATVPVTLALLLGVSLEVVHFSASIGMPNQYPQYPPAYYDASPGLSAIARLSNAGPLVYRYIAEPSDLIPPNAGDVKPVLGVLGHRGTMLVSEFDYFGKGGWGPGASDALDRLGVRWVISDKPVDGLHLLDQGTGYFIYERPHALSVFWTFDPKTGQRAPAPIQAVRWGENTVEIRLGPIEAGRQLVFAQPTYPGWVASADGSQVPLGEQDIFPAITVTDGMRDIAFAYRPRLWPWLMVSLACAIAGILAASASAFPGRLAPLELLASSLSRPAGVSRFMK